MRPWQQNKEQATQGVLDALEKWFLQLSNFSVFALSLARWANQRGSGGTERHEGG